MRSFLERIGLGRRDLRAWAMYDWANSAFYPLGPAGPPSWRGPLLIALGAGVMSVITSLIYWMLESRAEREYELGKSGEIDKLEFLAQLGEYKNVVARTWLTEKKNAVRQSIQSAPRVPTFRSCAKFRTQMRRRPSLIELPLCRRLSRPHESILVRQP